MTIFVIALNYIKSHLGDAITMANTDNTIVKQIGSKIKYFRKVYQPNTSRMDFYDGITLSDDRVSKIEAGVCMPDFDFLINLSIQYKLPVDYFTESGFQIPDSAIDIIKDIDALTNNYSLQFKYEFLQELNILKYSIFTPTNYSELRSVTINETDKKLRGNILKNIRIKNKLSIDSLSSLIERSPSTIQRMEAGSGESSPYIWTKISKEFSIPMDLFLLNRVASYKPNLKHIINYLICDTFLGLTSEERATMLNIAKHYLKNKLKSDKDEL